MTEKTCEKPSNGTSQPVESFNVLSIVIAGIIVVVQSAVLGKALPMFSLLGGIVLMTIDVYGTMMIFGALSYRNAVFRGGPWPETPPDKRAEFNVGRTIATIIIVELGIAACTYLLKLFLARPEMTFLWATALVAPFLITFATILSDAI